MAQVRVEQVDAATGEILEGAVLAVFHPKRRNGFQSTGWVAMAQGPMMELAKADMSKDAWKVFAALIGQLDYENWIHVTQAELARQIGMSRQNFARALGKLLEVGVIARGPKIGGHATFKLEPSYGWKGSAKGHHEALAERIKLAGLTVHEGGV